LLVAVVVDLDAAISSHLEIGVGLFAATFEPGLGGGDFMPSSHVSFQVDVGHGLGLISLEVVLSEGKAGELLSVD